VELRTGTLVLVESKTGTHVLVEDRNSRSVGVDDRNSRSVGVDDRNSRSVGVDDRNSPTGPVPHSGADSFDCRRLELSYWPSSTLWSLIVSTVRHVTGMVRIT
jgi:hypothetical protein